jgi:2-dehydro-3-deoxyglucarate aldolase
MDAGAHGVIVPMVNSQEDAFKAVESVKYPPLGKRGVGLARAQGYGLEFQRYKEWINKKSIVVVQIEHIEAVNNLEKILRVKEVDAFIVGPYDLSASLGRPGDFDDPQVKSALKEVMRVAAGLKKTSGFHVIPPEYRRVEEKIRDGYRFIAFSLDALFMGDKCAGELKQIKKKGRS